MSLDITSGSCPGGTRTHGRHASRQSTCARVQFWGSGLAHMVPVNIALDCEARGPWLKSYVSGGIDSLKVWVAQSRSTFLLCAGGIGVDGCGGELGLPEPCLHPGERDSADTHAEVPWVRIAVLRDAPSGGNPGRNRMGRARPPSGRRRHQTSLARKRPTRLSDKVLTIVPVLTETRFRVGAD